MNCSKESKSLSNTSLLDTGELENKQRTSVKIFLFRKITQKMPKIKSKLPFLHSFCWVEKETLQFDKGGEYIYK